MFFRYIIVIRYLIFAPKGKLNKSTIRNAEVALCFMSRKGKKKAKEEDIASYIQ